LNDPALHPRDRRAGPRGLRPRSSAGLTGRAVQAMAYIDSLLASGERPIKGEHQHWFILVPNAAYGVVALVIAIFLLFISGNLGQGAVRDILGWAIVIIVIGGLAYLGWESLRWTNREFVVTTRRVLQMEGVINKKV